MTKEDITLLLLIVLFLVLLGHSAAHFADAFSADAELSTQLDLLDKQTIGGDCEKQPGCEAANWKLTLETKRSDVSKGLLASSHDKWKAAGEAALTILGMALVLYLYRELWERLSSRWHYDAALTPPLGQ